MHLTFNSRAIWTFQLFLAWNILILIFLVRFAPLLSLTLFDLFCCWCNNALDKIGFQIDYLNYSFSIWQEVFQLLTGEESYLKFENAAKFRVRVLASHFAFARHEIEINWRLGFSDIFDRSDPLLRAYINITRALVLRTLTLWDQQLLWCSNFNQLMMLKKNGQWCDILRP